jgi:hypothetical protein
MVNGKEPFTALNVSARREPCARWVLILVRDKAFLSFYYAVVER